jgi:phosphate transport system ATP-binding protein
MTQENYKIESRNVHLHYGSFHALKGINLQIEKNTVTALIGPSGCGKSTYLRLFNRMNDLIDGIKIEGLCLIDGKDIYSREVKIDDLRKRVGMVFQISNPFPKSIFDNVAYGLRVNGITDKDVIQEAVEVKVLPKRGLVTKSRAPV